MRRRRLRRRVRPRRPARRARRRRWRAQRAVGARARAARRSAASAATSSLRASATGTSTRTGGARKAWKHDGTLTARNGKPVVVNGVWGIAFGNGGDRGSARHALRRRRTASMARRERARRPRSDRVDRAVVKRAFSVALHRRVEGDLRRREVGAPDEGDRFRGAPVAVHAGVFPLDRERALVADRGSACGRARRSRHRRDRVGRSPSRGLGAEVEMRAENRAPSVEAPLRVLDVDVVDAGRRTRARTRPDRGTAG